MLSRRFKIGDKVRVTEPSNFGFMGTVSGAYMGPEQQFVTVVSGNDERRFWIEEVELVNDDSIKVFYWPHLHSFPGHSGSAIAVARTKEQAIENVCAALGRQYVNDLVIMIRADMRATEPDVLKEGDALPIWGTV